MIDMTRRLLIVAILLLTPNAAAHTDAPAKPQAAEEIDLRGVFEELGPIATLWYQHVQTLSNPFFEGRVPESRGMDIAKEYVEFWFRRYGLEAAFPVHTDTPGGGAEAETSREWITYRQPFTYRTIGDRMRARVSDAVLALNGEVLNEREDFAVLGVSGSGRITAPLSFVGYAIEEGEDGYTSFDDDADLTGRIALVLRYEPLGEDGRSMWGGRQFSEHANLGAKFRALRDRGAAAIIMVNPPGVQGGARGLETIGRSGRFGSVLTIPVVQVTPEVADRLVSLAAPGYGDLMAWRRRADLGEVATVHFQNRLQITVGCTVTRGGARTGIETANVGAVLRGRGSLADEWLVIGAHMDHIGHGEFGTSPQYRGQLHPGADDNASGTAGLLILAKTLSEEYAGLSKDANARSILFIAFSAEESGLHGSRYFTNNPTVPLDTVTAMLNMDMIGRLTDGKLSVLGTGSAEEFERIIERHVNSERFNPTLGQGSSGRSDEANFINARVPAVHFFTGMHAEYHSPNDVAHTVNPAGARDVLVAIHGLAMDLARKPNRLTFTEPRRGRGQDRGYAPVRLGIRPGMDVLDRGMRVEEVYLDTSASAAGIESGDVILTWDGEEINAVGDLFRKLQEHKPGDVVVLRVERDGVETDIEVVLRASERE